jgi:two-component system, NarL family, nitrate/nitrite response regulator NarL
MAESLQRATLRGANGRSDSLCPRLVIVSDVLLYRQGLEASLAKDGRVEVVGVTSTDDALPLLSTRLPDIVLIDGGGSECLALARALRSQLPTIRLVGFGISGGAEKLVDCAQCGIAAFVDSNASASDLADAAIAALNGELACSPKVSALLCERLAHYATAGQEAEGLTRREREIAVLIGEGLSNKEIAKDLKIGPSTVKNHVHNILEKLRVRRRAGIAHQLSAFRWDIRSPAAE